MLKQSLLAITIITISGCGGSSGGASGVASGSNKIKETIAANDDEASAQEISIDTQISGKLTDREDESDYYSLTVPSAKTITIELRAANVDFDIEINDDNYSNVSTSSTEDGYESVTRLFSPGTYYIVVRQWVGSGDYTLVVK